MSCECEKLREQVGVMKEALEKIANMPQDFCPEDEFHIVEDIAKQALNQEDLK